ncbi:MAG: response regulator [Lapillicoccus sp.]
MEPAFSVVPTPGADSPGLGWVLVCDDTPSIRTLIRINVELSGFTVLESADGQEALDILHAHLDDLPEVVVIDAQMEPRDGWWLARTIRRSAELAHIPVVMATAAIQDQEKRRAAKTGIDAFVRKPFDPDHLVDLIEGFAREGRAFDTSARP